MDIAAMRKDYKMKTLNEKEVTHDAMDQFHVWFKEALDSEVPEPNAFTLATCTQDGRPSARIVLLKGVSDEGFIFFTNYDSRKGAEIAQNPNVSMAFLWHELERQVRVEGRAIKISRAENELYFYSRPFESQISALISPQSSVIEGKAGLELMHAEKVALYEGHPVPFPENWGGYVIIPERIEFWQGRQSRFHDRLLYTKQATDWKIERLAP